MQTKFNKHRSRLDPGDVIPDGWSHDEAMLISDFFLVLVSAIGERYYEDQTGTVLLSSRWGRPKVRRLNPGDVIPAYWSLKEANLVFDFLLLVKLAISDCYDD